MTFDVTFPLVMLAAYGLFNLLLSGAVVLAWRAGLRRYLTEADAVLGVRLLPAMGSATLALTVVLPAFVLYEPRHAHDQPGPLLVISALFSIFVLADGIRRGISTWRATRALARRSQAIIAARSVASACDSEEFRQVLAHEAAHRDARDNLKLFLLLTLPDALAWLPAGGALTERWRAATELEADERASGADPRKRLALASALIKVARLSIASGRPRKTARVSAAPGGIEQRVRRLLVPSPTARRGFFKRRLVTCALLLPVLAVPLYASVHRLIEALVAFGR